MKLYLLRRVPGKSFGLKTCPSSGRIWNKCLAETIYYQINRTIGHYSVAQFDSLYKYILNNVFIISIEYTNVKDALRYFLNINSLREG